MDDGYRVEYVEKPESSVWGAIGGGLHDYNIRQAGPDHGQGLCYVLAAADGSVAGGLLGETHWDWLYITLLWLPEALRGRGHGSQLLALAEEEARRRGARHAYLDTFSFQAPDFYRRHGYEVFGELEDFPTGHRRYYLRKRLE